MKPSKNQKRSENKTTEKAKLESIERILNVADQWSANQTMPESAICIAAMKDIRNVVRS